MNKDGSSTKAARAYVEAYAAHYTQHDYPLALRLYGALVTTHPSAQEAEYSRMQIQNIVSAVVPKQELFEAQLELVRAHLKRDEEHDAAASSVQAVGVERPN